MDLLTRWFLHSLRYEIKCASSCQGLHERISPHLFSLFSFIKSLLNGAVAINQTDKVLHSALSAYTSVFILTACKRTGVPDSHSFFTTIPHPEILPEYRFVPNTASRAKLLANTASRVAVKSRIPSRIFAFSESRTVCRQEAGAGDFPPATFVEK